MELLLKQILDELRASRTEIPLGFGDAPKTRYIYANRQYPDCLWYFWEGAKNIHEPIGSSAITGVIEKVEIEDKEFRGKKDPKLNIYVKADKPYVIQSGMDTMFAKGLLYTLAKLPSEAFKKPITIAVEPGDTEQVLFARVYNPATGVAVFAPYEGDVNWKNVFEKLVEKLGKS